MSTTAQVSWGNQSLTVGPSGFRWQQSNGEVLEGPWSRVTSVMTLVASSSVNGVHVGTWQHLGMAFDTGAGFTFHSRDQAAFDVAPLAVQYAAPHIVPRLAAQLEAGQTVAFGPLSLSRDSVGFKGKRWPLAQVAGHRTVQGHWLMDVGPKAAPRLAVQVMLNKVPNFFAFRALLEKLVPGAEYADDAPDLGSVLRPSASSHDPRTLSGRARLMMLGGLVAVGAVIGLGAVGVMTWESYQHDQAREAMEARLAGFLKVAEAAPVPAGQAFACDRSVEDPYGLVFVMRGPKDVNRPGLYDKAEPFSLSGTSASSVGPYARPSYFVLGEVRGISGPPKGQRVVTLALTVVDAASRQVVCSGELAGQFEETAEWSASWAMADLLVRSVCHSARCTAGSTVVLVKPGDQAAAAGPASAEPPSPGSGAAPPSKAPPPKSDAKTQVAIRKVVQAHQREIQFCYEQALRKDPGLAGRVAVAWTVGRSGEVSDAKVSQTSLGNAGVERCIVERVRRWKFPELQGRVVSVSFPWVFQAEG
jgi:TonB family protein